MWKLFTSLLGQYTLQQILLYIIWYNNIVDIKYWCWCCTLHTCTYLVCCLWIPVQLLLIQKYTLKLLFHVNFLLRPSVKKVKINLGGRIFYYRVKRKCYMEISRSQVVRLTAFTAAYSFTQGLPSYNTKLLTQLMNDSMEKNNCYIINVKNQGFCDIQ